MDGYSAFSKYNNNKRGYSCFKVISTEKHQISIVMYFDAIKPFFVNTPRRKYCEHVPVYISSLMFIALKSGTLIIIN